MIRTTVAAVALLASATAASAHSRSAATVPADGATVAEVPQFSIDFDAPMRVTAFQLTSGDETLEVQRETGMVPVTEFRAAPAAPLGPGDYRIEWRGLSEDGHPMQGAFSFTVAE